jgi:hypothetical protein
VTTVASKDVPNPPILKDVSIPTEGSVQCLVYNQRRAANLTIVKRVVPQNDPGKFNLRIGTDGTFQTWKADATNGQSTPNVLLALGEHEVSETAGTGTNLADYKISTTCVDENNNDEVVVGPTTSTVENGMSTPVTVNLKKSYPSPSGLVSGEAHDYVCTITNTSLKGGSLTVTKHLPEEGDTGRFNLVVTHNGEEVVRADDVGDGESTMPKFLPFGTYVVSEEAALGTNPDHYTSSIDCIDQATKKTIASGPGPSLPVTTTGLSNVQCRITNALKTPPTFARLKVDLRVEPGDGPGAFPLLIGGKQFAGPIGPTGTTGSLLFELGKHEVSVRGAAGTSLADCSISTRCVDTTTGKEVVPPRINCPSR